MDFFGRLREERARLGLTQQEVADTANVHVKTVRRWESQVPMPLDAMVPLLAIGYDVQYVASGLRSKNAHELREKGVDYEVAPGYTRDEVEMLKAYRALMPAQREQARAMLGVLAVKGSGSERTGRARSEKAEKAEKAESAAAKRRTRRSKG